MNGTGAKALVLLLLVPAVVRGAFEPRPAGARNTAMGGLCAAGGVDGWGCNPAQLLRCNSLLVGASVTPGLFGIPDLTHFQAMAVVPSGDIRFGLSFSRFGTDLYRELQSSVSMATVVPGNASVGVSVRLYHLAIAGYGSAASAGIDVGLRVQPAPTVSAAFAFTNCTGSSLGACKEELPRSFAAALDWSPEPLSMVVEVAKEEGLPLTASWGGECRLAGVIHIRAGCSTENPGVSVGAGLAWRPVRLDYAWRWHAALGGTHTVSVTLESLF